MVPSKVANRWIFLRYAVPFFFPAFGDLLFEHKVDRQYQKNEGDDVVGPKGLCFEDQKGEYSKDHQGDHLLDDLQLDQAEGTSVFPEPDPVGWNLESVLEQGDAPAYQDDRDKPEFTGPLPFVEL